jgi:hypothetical protein
MPKLYNTVTKQYMMMPDSYVGKFPFITEEEAASLRQPVVVEVEQPAAKPKKKKAEYIHPAIDADGDGRIQDGTPFERPVGTELSPEEVTAIQEADSAL